MKGFMMQLFDSHCHLQDKRLAADLAGRLAAACAAGVAGWMCCGSAEADWDAVAEIGRGHPGVRVSYGLHPWYIAGRAPGWEQRLRARLEADPAAGVGEIGLDHAIDGADHADQEAAFKTQYGLSCELRRPASIHCRRAWGRLPELLAEHGPHPAGFVVHSFSGAREALAPLTALNGYFSFSASITFPNNRRGREALAAAPAERLLIETDAPDIPPFGAPASPGEKSANEPANLARVLAAAAEIRGETPEELAKQLWWNAERVFDGGPIPS